jgi:guanylate kinase
LTTEKSDTISIHKKQDVSAGHTTGHLFIVSAPSGAGKTTLCHAVRQQYSELAYSVSYTTRLPRDGEQHGRDYYYISVQEFELGITQGRWAEWAKVHGNFYGSSARWIDRTLSAGRHILMDIDMQGARQMLQCFPQAITIFIMPPSMEILEQRLRARGTDHPDTISLRLANAAEEIAQKDICRHILVNDDLEKAKQQLAALIKGYF